MALSSAQGLLYLKLVNFNGGQTQGLGVQISELAMECSEEGYSGGCPTLKFGHPTPTPASSTETCLL